MKYLIIGNSAAGIGALESIRQCDQQGSITVVSDENTPAYSRCLLSYFLADSVDETGLLFRPHDFHQERRAEAILGRRVETIDPASQQVVCDDGAVLDYDKLLIATGSSPKFPGNISEKINGIFALRTIADAKAIKSRIGTTQNAVVLGGGLVGLKAAFALKKCGLRVSVVVRSPHVLSQMIDFDAAQIVMDRLRGSGIEALTGTDVTGVETKKEKLVAVRLHGETQPESKSTEKVLPCDMLIAAKGVKANMGLIGDTGIECNWGIVTNPRMQTSTENIYAAGDVAETFDMATEESSVNALWTCAVQQGKIAGFNMAGRERKYDGSLSMNSINFAGVDLISFGLVRPREDAGYEVLVDSLPESGVYKKLVLKGNRIKGLILVNKIDSAGVLLSLLGRKIDVTDYKDELLSDRFSYAQVLGHEGAEELFRYTNAAHGV